MCRHEIDEDLPQCTAPHLAGVMKFVGTARSRVSRRTGRQYRVRPNMPEGQRVLCHVRRIGIATDGEIIILFEVRPYVGPSADREYAARKIVSGLRGHASGKEISPSLAHRAAMNVHEPGSIPD